MQPVVISAMSAKGGAGKTTLVRALASALVFNKRRVLLIDFDPTRALARWAERAEANGLTSPLLETTETTSTADLVRIIGTAINGKAPPDYIFLDTPGRSGDWADTVAGQSDLILTPMILTRTDIEKGMETLAWYDRLHARTADKAALPVHVTVLTRLSTRKRNGEDYLAKSQSEFLADLEKLVDPLPFGLRERQAYQDMDNEGLLGPKADQLRQSTNFIVRDNAKNFDNALHEACRVANALITRATEPAKPALSAEQTEA